LHDRRISSFKPRESDSQIGIPGHDPNDGELAVQTLSSTRRQGSFHFEDTKFDVSVTTADGVKVYQKVENGWKLIAWNHQTSMGWVEDSWGADGKFVQNIWQQKQHGAPGSSDQISQLIVQG